VPRGLPFAVSSRRLPCAAARRACAPRPAPLCAASSRACTSSRRPSSWRSAPRGSGSSSGAPRSSFAAAAPPAPGARPWVLSAPRRAGLRPDLPRSPATGRAARRCSRRRRPPRKGAIPAGRWRGGAGRRSGSRALPERGRHSPSPPMRSPCEGTVRPPCPPHRSPRLSRRGRRQAWPVSATGSAFRDRRHRLRSRGGPASPRRGRRRERGRVPAFPGVRRCLAPNARYRLRSPAAQRPQ